MYAFLCPKQSWQRTCETREHNDLIPGVPPILHFTGTFVRRNLSKKQVVFSILKLRLLKLSQQELVVQEVRNGSCG